MHIAVAKLICLSQFLASVAAQQCYKANKGKSPSAPGPQSVPSGPPPSDPKPSQPSNEPPVDTTQFEQACLGPHNQQRSADGVPPLQWNSGLVDSALTWAKKLADEVKGLKHSRAGENLFMGRNDCGSAVGAWVAEKPKFTSGVIDENYHEYGHYTQVVWSRTTSVGCAVYNNVVVCHYDPPGNFVGQSPFK